VGGNAQIKAMKKVAGTLKLDLAQYRELEAFAKFGSDLDKSTQKTLARGARLVELLKQGQYSPAPVEKQVVSIYLGTNGFMDDIPVYEVKRFEKEITDYIEVNYNQIYESIKKEKQLTDPTIADIKKAAQEVLATFKANA
jgi:F-type H+-transporting ATPase subunit alpha